MKFLKSIIGSFLPFLLMISFSNTKIVAQTSHGVKFSIPANKNRVHTGRRRDFFPERRAAQGGLELYHELVLASRRCDRSASNIA